MAPWIGVQDHDGSLMKSLWSKTDFRPTAPTFLPVCRGRARNISLGVAMPLTIVSSSKGTKDFKPLH